jgi:hypothetical protein
MGTWFSGEWKGWEGEVFLNRSLVQCISGPGNLAWSDTVAGFETEDFSVYERRYECEPGAAAWKVAEKCPVVGAGFDPKALAKAIAGSLSVYSLDKETFRSVILEAKNSTLSVRSPDSWAGEYLSEIPLFGEANFTGRFNAELLTRIAGSMKCPTMALKDMTLWVWDGESKVALQGMRL